MLLSQGPITASTRFPASSLSRALYMRQDIPDHKLLKDQSDTAQLSGGYHRLPAEALDALQDLCEVRLRAVDLKRQCLEPFDELPRLLLFRLTRSALTCAVSPKERRRRWLL